MTLASFIRHFPDFSTKALTYKIKVFAWYLHEEQQQERFLGADLNKCFDEVHLARPSNTGAMLRGMANTNPKQVLRDSKGYRLSASSRDEMARQFPVRETAAQATGLLRALEARMTNSYQRTYLAETLVCFGNGAYRASIVMAWNLAYSHVCDYIFDNALAKFNAQLKIVRPKADPVVKRSDFEDLKESTVVEVARGASILSAASAKTLNEKLGKRNTAAHPSSTVVKSVTAEEVVHDLVENILLRSVL